MSVFFLKLSHQYFSPFISKSEFQRSFALLSCWLHVYSEIIIFFLFLSILVTFYRYFGPIAYPAPPYIYFVYILWFSFFHPFNPSFWYSFTCPFRTKPVPFFTLPRSWNFYLYFTACSFFDNLTISTQPIPFLLYLFLFCLQKEQPSHLSCIFFIYLVSFLPKTSFKKDTTSVPLALLSLPGTISKC